ncbi:MAG: ROK family protein, partial [Anaerolineae bacterium]|nr:ROK family protein [Anaerolineae bacterium]
MRQTRAPHLVIGVDVGGTKIAAAVVDAAGHAFGRVQVPTDVRSAEATLDSIANAVGRTLSEAGVAKDQVLAAGLGIPGKVDAEAGIGILSVNLGWRDVP